MTLLINNAGALPPVRAFPGLSDEEVIDNVAVNVTFGALIVKALMNGWFARRACVLVMGSVGAVMTLWVSSAEKLGLDRGANDGVIDQELQPTLHRNHMPISFTPVYEPSYLLRIPRFRPPPPPQQSWKSSQ